MRAFALLLTLAMIAARGGAVATVPESADEATATLTSVQSGVEVRGGAASEAPLRVLNPWRYVAANSLHTERAALDSQSEISAPGRQGARTPGTWALVISGLLGALAIGRRRLPSIADRSIAARRRLPK